MALSGSGTGKHSFAFIFPVASGHTNPSLGVARSLRKQGHEVSYLSRDALRSAIEDTGANFYDNTKYIDELYENRKPDLTGAHQSLTLEYGLQNDDRITGRLKLAHIHALLSIPGTLRWLQEVGATAIVFDPLTHFEAALAAEVAGLPCAALITTAGPGSMAPSYKEMLRGSVEDFLVEASAFAPGRAAHDALHAKYGLDLPLVANSAPFGRLDCLDFCDVTLVTTSEDLQDPMDEEMAESYEGLRFEYVGPLLDEQGSKRCTGEKGNGETNDNRFSSEEDIMARVLSARQQQRPVILVSMGTMITGPNPSVGWTARSRDADGTVRGISGKELCQAAWAGAFDAFGAASSQEGPLLVVALGHQEDALEGLSPPPNAVLAPALPQVDLLRAGVSLFLTHGGQNSFTESLRYGTPVVVCPGFADQPVNGRKAVRLGVGLSVPRPMPLEHEHQQALLDYRSDVSSAIQEVFQNPAFRARAERQADQLENAGGVPRAVDILLKMANGEPDCTGPALSVSARKLGA
mmetsp:Transcript_92706/g.193774  ORF Transcript_92706/g.193774 Transcript_92706/m.193774 type:complete len:521 (-) Transcript_92706:581-2143(-)|eukprot:CAMPEP_0206456788 /NCGR_PEP_ID=MMETSP0324_2-20121206/22575_1 /ASSEMBLY_ACC=CAM_ASM_000836 /TAXON_ID=2866 /ORGANISM="Crypthecodinium cohnii, Strain Seligo" /LENGTH=520 /DNA_ID=CAMNT_0053927787 /DNA_START=84 /DNA_END=1646 /DNA_ORIENTATION=+